MVRFLLVVLLVWWAPGRASAQWQRAAVCGDGCGGGCGPCAGDNNSGPREPAKPSAWLRNRDQILEGRGVVAYDRCVADFAKQDFDSAIDECKSAVAKYADAFGSPTSARGREAAQALAAAENARAAALFHRGKCEEAAGLFRAAADQDPSNGAYGRNAALFTASACAAAASGARRTTAAPPPPPPLPPPYARVAPVALHFTGTAIPAEVLQAGRDALHQGGGIAIATAANGVPGGELAAQVLDAAEMRKSYNQLAHDLVDEATGAASEAASILGNGTGDVDHVIAAPERMARMVNQYVSDEIVDAIVKKTGSWLIGHGVP